MSAGVPHWAVRGARVVCIRAPATRRRGLELFPEPVVGNVYTLDGWSMASSGEAWVGLVELNIKSAFRLSMFRPAVEPKTEAEDVALFAWTLKQNQHDSAPSRERVE